MYDVSSIDLDKLANTVLSIIESTFGPRVSDAIFTRISEDYLGGEMNVHSVIIQRPDLFERVFIEILGEEVGMVTLAKICKRTKSELGLDNNDDVTTTTLYSKRGDFAKFVARTIMGPQVGTIMVVDDDDDILTATAESLRACGYDNVRTFNDPVKALEHFKANKEEKNDYALILTDIRMPAMDGLQLAKQLLRVDANVRIVLMSAFELDEELKAHLRTISQEDGFLQKPFRKKELCIAVTNAIRGQ